MPLLVNKMAILLVHINYISQQQCSLDRLLASFHALYMTSASRKLTALHIYRVHCADQKSMSAQYALCEQVC